jgi:hypothetical protein
MIHDLKCWCDSFIEILHGKQKFIYQLNDRDYNVDDILWLRAWDPDMKKYIGPSIDVHVTSILKTGFGLPKDYCIMSIERCDKYIDKRNVVISHGNS